MSRPLNELELDVTLHRVVLRDFDYRLTPIVPAEGSPGTLQRELELELGSGDGTDGIELLLTPRDMGFEILLRFERSEFVSVATGGLAMLDAADATDQTKGGEN